MTPFTFKSVNINNINNFTFWRQKVSACKTCCFLSQKKVFLQVWSYTLVPPVILLGSELNLMVMTGDCSRGGGGVGGWGDDGANSASRLTKSRDNFASLCNVAASIRDNFASLCNVDVSSDAKLGFECVNPWCVIIPPDVLSSSWKWHLNTVCTRNTLFFICSFADLFVVLKSFFFEELAFDCLFFVSECVVQNHSNASTTNN